MNNRSKFLLTGLGAFLIGISTSNFAMSDVQPGFKVAVVDVSQVVTASSQVQALKKEQQTKAQEILKYIEKARKDVAQTTDEKKKKALEEKYSKDLISKRETIEKEYTTKLQAIDKNISDKIAEYAKNNSYNVVLAKGIVLYGGNDITPDIIKTVK